LDFEQHRQSIIDEEDLRLLPILYWVSGGLAALYGAFVLAYFIFIGLARPSVQELCASVTTPVAVGGSNQIGPE
jgi:hypothetical protein